jgi:hypothetical protein
MPWSRSCARKKCNKRELCLARLSFLYLFCAFLCPREIGVLSVSSLERMAGTTRLELATSAVTVSGLQVLSTTWKSTDGTASHWKYIIGNVIVYRDVYRASRDIEAFLNTPPGDE